MVDADLLRHDRRSRDALPELPVAEVVAAVVPEPAKAHPPAGKGGDDHPAADKKEAATATIRVDLERVDRLIDLVGELVINQAMLAERVTEAGLARVSAVSIGLDELEQLTREIQDSVMAIRAQPVKSVFQRMPRLVREVAAQTGKTVRLVTEGEGTEVDKTVIERLERPAHPHDPQRHRPRAGEAGGAPRRRQAGGGRPEGRGSAPIGPHRHRDLRRRRRHQPAARARDRRRQGSDRRRGQAVATRRSTTSSSCRASPPRPSSPTSPGAASAWTW